MSEFKPNVQDAEILKLCAVEIGTSAAGQKMGAAAVSLPEATGTASQTAPTQAVQTGGVYNATPPTLADGKFSRTQMDAKGNTLVALRNSAGSPVENTEGPLLASAARTAVATTPNQTNYIARGVILTLNVSANPGGSETLTLRIRFVDPVSGAASVVIASFATAAAQNAIYRMVVYPGSNATSENPVNVKFVAAPVPRTWVAEVFPSGAGSWTYSLSYQYIV